MAIAATAREDIALGGRSSVPGANGFYRCLSVRAPPVTPLTLIRSFEGYRIQHQWVSLNAIAPAMRRAVVVAEDPQFCGEFIGIDFSQSIARSTYGPPADGPRGQARSPCRPLVTYSNAQAAASFANFTSSGSRRSLHCSGPGGACSRCISMSWNSGLGCSVCKLLRVTTSARTHRN
jgi:hypothetical protein